ncbi:MAG: phosphonate C-P lyase system protein PhnH [Ktedonobacteraceae bacterium]
MQSATRTEQEERIRYSAVTFRHLLDSLARPGKINTLEYPHVLGEPPFYHSTIALVPLNLYALGALMTLLDQEVTFVLAANGTWLEQQDVTVQWIVVRSGAGVASPENATFAFFCDGKSGGLLTQLSVGTLQEPESSATAFYCVEQVSDAVGLLSDDERSNGCLQLELSGPGIKDVQSIRLAGLEREELQHILAMRQGYPLGVDVYLIDAVGHCVGLPRTTRIKG